MNKKSYIIVCNTSLDFGQTYTQYVLSDDNTFMWDINNAMKFPSIQSAREWWMRHRHSIMAPLHKPGPNAIKMGIKGPRGGIHPILHPKREMVKS